MKRWAAMRPVVYGAASYFAVFALSLALARAISSLFTLQPGILGNLGPVLLGSAAAMLVRFVAAPVLAGFTMARLTGRRSYLKLLILCGTVFALLYLTGYGPLSPSLRHTPLLKLYAVAGALGLTCGWLGAWLGWRPFIPDADEELMQRLRDLNP